MHQLKPAEFIFSRFFLAPLLLTLAFIICKPASAERAQAFLTNNQSPFSLIYGIPLPGSAQLLSQNESRFISSFNVSNTLNSQTGSNDSLYIDIETWQLNLLYDYGFKENWMLRIQLPFISHNGGFMDSPIDAYHQALGLPEGLRPSTANDQIEVSYSQNAVQQLLLNSRQASAGDLSLQLAWQAENLKNKSTSYWLSLKLPTGDADKLTGSGAMDLSIWTSMDYQLTQSRWLYGQAGFIYMGNGDVLSDIQKNWASFANAGIKFQPWDNIELKAQLDMHSALYDSDIKFLGNVIQLTFGGSYHISKIHKLDFAVAEDIQENASPDVNFNISWWINY